MTKAELHNIKSDKIRKILKHYAFHTSTSEDALERAKANWHVPISMLVIQLLLAIAFGPLSFDCSYISYENGLGFIAMLQILQVITSFFTVVFTALNMIYSAEFSVFRWDNYNRDCHQEIVLACSKAHFSEYRSMLMLAVYLVVAIAVYLMYDATVTKSWLKEVLSFCLTTAWFVQICIFMYKQEVFLDL